MATKRLETCYSCRYWEGQGVRQRGPKGVCRRYPPMVTPRDPEGRFPITQSSDWCGEWKRESLPPVAAPSEGGRTLYDDLES